MIPTTLRPRSSPVLRINTVYFSVLEVFELHWVDIRLRVLRRPVANPS